MGGGYRVPFCFGNLLSGCSLFVWSHSFSVFFESVFFHLCCLIISSLVSSGSSAALSCDDLLPDESESLFPNNSHYNPSPQRGIEPLALLFSRPLCPVTWACVLTAAVSLRLYSSAFVDRWRSDGAFPALKLRAYLINAGLAAIRHFITAFCEKSANQIGFGGGSGGWMLL